jgi:hypothetical protein
VIDLGAPLVPDLWAGIKDGCRAEIHKGLVRHIFDKCSNWSMKDYHRLHVQDHGEETRRQAGWDCWERWIPDHGLLVMARIGITYIDGAFFIVYKNGAYYASAASIAPRTEGTHHAVIWTAIKLLRERGIRFLDMGDVTDRGGLSDFKRSFGGEPKPYTLVVKA